MSSFDIFPYVWLTFVAVLGVVNFFWALDDLKRGTAFLGVLSRRPDRVEDPFAFWFAVCSKFLAVPFAAFMFWFGLDMFKW